MMQWRRRRPRISAATTTTWLAALALLLTYLATLLPGVGGFGDTAKFQFVGQVLGIPHATGYPAYLLLNHVFLRVMPFGTAAWQANLLSALLAATAGVLVHRLLLRLAVSPWAALAAVLLLGWNRTVWEAAVVAEVYALHLCLMAATLLLLLRWRQDDRDRDLLAALLAFAFAMGNHLTSLVLLPGLAWLACVRGPRRVLRPGVVAGAAACVSLAVGQYGYLFWRTADPTTPYVENPVADLRDLWGVLSGESFRGAMFAFDAGHLATVVLPAFGRLLLAEMPLALPLALWGLWRRRRDGSQPFLAALVVVFLLGSFWAMNYNVHDVRLHVIPAYVVIAIFAALGLDHLAARLAAAVRAPRRRWLPAALLALPVVPLFVNWPVVDQSGNRQLATRVEEVLRRVDSGAVVISPDYTWSESFWYYLIGQGEGRRGIHLMHHFDADTVAAYLVEGRRFTLPEERRRVPGGLRVFCLDPGQARRLEAAGLRVEPRGAIARILPP